MKFIKALLFIIATAVQAVTLLCIPESAGAISISYTSIVGIYLGLDIAGMISKSATLSKGDYADLHTYKYVLASICLLVLIGICFYLRSSIDVRTPLTSFITSIMIILGCLIGGFEGNKIAARMDGEK